MSTTDKNYIISQIANIVNADANGAIVSLNTSSYTANLGPVGNVTITGGSAGQALTTDGSGTLSWTTVTTNNVANANYAAYAGNVTIAAQSNITSVGTLSSLTVGGVSNLNTVGNLRITGGSNGQMLTTNGSGTLSWATANVASSTQVGQFGLFLSTPPDSTWLPASTGPYLVSSYPALGSLLGTPTVTNSGNASVSTDTFGSMVYGGGRYVLFPTTAGNTIKYSTNGSTWSNGGTMPAGVNWGTRVIWTGTTFFGVAYSTAGVAFTSPDGVTITNRTLPAITGGGNGYYSCCSNGSTIVALQYNAASGGAKVAKSIDNGVTWTSSVMPVNGGFDFIAFGGGKYITAIYGSSTGYYSTDAVTWTQFTLPRTGNWETASYNGSYWVMGTVTADTTMAMSYDGINWFSIPTPNGAAIWTDGLKWDGTYWYLIDQLSPGNLRYTKEVNVGWSTYNIGTGFNNSRNNIASDGAGTFIALGWTGSIWAAYKYTFTAASTFSVGSGPVSVSRGTWWIKS